jgi:hypothetical protein
MKNQIRIRTPRRELLPGEQLVTFSWPNPRWRPAKDRRKKLEQAEEKLYADAARFKARAIFAGL